MARKVARQGVKPSCEFFDGLSLLGKAKLMSLFQIAADRGKFHNPEEFGDLGDGLYKFRSIQIRMPFAYAKSERGLILVTHGFIKKKDRTPKEEIARAWRIYGE